MTTDQAVERQAAHVSMTADVFRALQTLVAALDKTHWSSWQTTACFSAELDAARKVVERANAQS